MLCRRTSAPPPRQIVLPTFLPVMLLAAAIGAGGYYALAPKPRPTAAIPSAAMLYGTATKHATCGAECGQAHLACDDQCLGRGDSGACQQYCFSEADTCFNNCNTKFQKPAYPWSYHYATETMPDWSEVLVSSEALGEQLLDCSHEPISALAFVRVPKDKEKPTSVGVHRDQHSAANVSCVTEALQRAEFPRSALGDYAFLARFDNRHDRLKLVIKQAGAEIESAPRRRPMQSEEASQTRLFEAKVAVSKQSEASIQQAKADLATQRNRLASLRDQIAAKRRELARKPGVVTWVETVKNPSPAREDEQRLKSQRERAEAAEKKNRAELEDYRRINREYREREQRVRDRRVWEDILSQ